jgi:hypothetical protein
MDTTDSKSVDTDPLLLKTSTRRRRRKIRASFSPRKKPLRRPRVSDPFPEPEAKATEMATSGVSAKYTGDLFSDFTLWNPETKKFDQPNPDQRERIFEKLKERYPNVSAITTIFPWMLIEFEDSVPDDKERPFLIAGLVGVFLLEGEPFPLGVSRFGVAGLGPATDIPSHISNDLRPYHAPSKETVQYLAEAVDAAKHISTYPRQLLFELEAMEESKFQDALTDLPRSFGRLAAHYHNGTFLHTLASRIKTPDPRFDADGVELVVDDTNYLAEENGGKVRPGCMLECRGLEVDGRMVGECTSNAGVVVSKNGESRLTCASHTWDAVEDKVVYHGSAVIGEVDETLSEDIGMVDPQVPVSNKFLEFDCTARSLIRADLIDDDDIVSVDSCYTGAQPLKFAGNRWGKRRRRDPGPSGGFLYVVLEQGIYETSQPILPKPPVVRLGMCGTPLLRIANGVDAGVTPVGDILGFFLWCDIASYVGPMLYCYSQPCDPLISAGWEVANLGE